MYVHCIALKLTGQWLCRGSQNFRQRIVYATLSGKALRIDAIRENSDSPGLQDYEASFLRLVEKVTNGCQVEINETGGYPTERHQPPSDCHRSDLLSARRQSARSFIPYTGMRRAPWFGLARSPGWYLPSWSPAHRGPACPQHAHVRHSYTRQAPTGRARQRDARVSGRANTPRRVCRGSGCHQLPQDTSPVCTAEPPRRSRVHTHAYGCRKRLVEILSERSSKFGIS